MYSVVLKSAKDSNARQKAINCMVSFLYTVRLVDIGRYKKKQVLNRITYYLYKFHSIEPSLLRIHLQGPLCFACLFHLGVSVGRGLLGSGDWTTASTQDADKKHAISTWSLMGAVENKTHNMIFKKKSLGRQDYSKGDRALCLFIFLIVTYLDITATSNSQAIQNW
ncbi:hypothetical protein F4703DRAFT_1917506 [Phycomyces blakesleeanus]